MLWPVIAITAAIAAACWMAVAFILVFARPGVRS